MHLGPDVDQGLPYRRQVRVMIQRHRLRSVRGWFGCVRSHEKTGKKVSQHQKREDISQRLSITGGNVGFIWHVFPGGT